MNLIRLGWLLVFLPLGNAQTSTRVPPKVNCRGCLDLSFLVYRNNYVNDGSRNLTIDTNKPDCIGGNGRDVECADSCVRIRMFEKKNVTTILIGSYYDCSTNVLVSHPSDPYHKLRHGFRNEANISDPIDGTNIMMEYKFSQSSFFDNESNFYMIRHYIRLFIFYAVITGLILFGVFSCYVCIRSSIEQRDRNARIRALRQNYELRLIQEIQVRQQMSDLILRSRLLEDTV